MDRLADERGARLGGEAGEVGRQCRALGAEAREEPVEVVVRFLRDGGGRQGAEADASRLDERQAEVAAAEDVENDEVLESCSRIAGQELLEPEKGRGRSEEGTAEAAVERRVAPPRAEDRPRLERPRLGLHGEPPGNAPLDRRHRLAEAEGGAGSPCAVEDERVEAFSAEREGRRRKTAPDASAVGADEGEAPDRRGPGGANLPVETEPRERRDAVGREELAAGLRPREGRLVDDGDARTGPSQDERRGAPREARAHDDGVESSAGHVRFQRRPWTKGPADLTSVPGRARAARARSSGMVQA